MGLVVTVVTVVVALVLLHFHLRSRRPARKRQVGGDGDSSAPYGDVYSHESGHSCRACENDADSGDGGSDGGGD